MMQKIFTKLRFNDKSVGKNQLTLAGDRLRRKGDRCIKITKTILPT